jgi:hypothetical protein
MGIETTIPASKRPQTYALDHETSGTGRKYTHKITNVYVQSKVYAYMHVYTYIPIHIPTHDGYRVAFSGVKLPGRDVDSPYLLGPRLKKE